MTSPSTNRGSEAMQQQTNSSTIPTAEVNSNLSLGTMRLAALIVAGGAQRFACDCSTSCSTPNTPGRMPTERTAMDDEIAIRQRPVILFPRTPTTVHTYRLQGETEVENETSIHRAGQSAGSVRKVPVDVDEKQQAALSRSSLSPSGLPAQFSLHHGRCSSRFPFPAPCSLLPARWAFISMFHLSCSPLLFNRTPLPSISSALACQCRCH
jgi:hypothetical protein